MSDGGFFMTHSDLFVIRLGQESVLEISNRFLQFFVALLSAIREPCIRKATGFGFGPRLAGRRCCSPSWESRSLLAGSSRCDRGPTNGTGLPHLSLRFCWRFEGFSMFQGTGWARRSPRYFCLGLP